MDRHAVAVKAYAQQRRFGWERKARRVLSPYMVLAGLCSGALLLGVIVQAVFQVLR